MGIKSYEELVVWQKSMNFVAAIYDATRGFPKEELYGLTSQLRRAAVSIPSNIAEGQSRRTPGEFLQSASCASGSLAECQTQIFLAERLGHLSPSDRETLILETREIGRLLGGLIRSLENSRS